MDELVEQLAAKAGIDNAVAEKIVGIILDFLRKGDVLIVFDYRRYQADTIESARIAGTQGCNVVLFTDPWLSPASAFARQVLVTSVETVGPFDSLVGATAVVEAMIAAVLNRLGPRAQARMQSLERLRARDVIGESEQPSG